MGIIFLAVLVAATVLYGRDLGWTWTLGCWGVFFLGMLLAGLSIPFLPAIFQAGAALTAAIQGIHRSRSEVLGPPGD